MACSLPQLLALVLAMMGATSLGIGVAHFIATYFLVFVPLCSNLLANCKYAETVVYAFIMPGVWGSAGTFATGILAIKTISNPSRWRPILTAVAFITAVALLPAMIGVSIVNVVKVINSPDGSSAALYNINTNTTSSSIVVYILPIIVVVMGFVEFFMTAGFLIYACCKMRAESSEKTDADKQETESAPAPAPAQVPLPSPGFLSPAPVASYSPYGPLPYRRPAPIYGDPSQNPGYLYRPGVRSFAPGRYPLATGITRPYPLAYPPTGY